jgi:hypothetical protein
VHNKLALLILAAFSLASCQRGSNLDAPREFFARNKIGSPDYGVMKSGNDHVITVHGFVDDQTNCLEIAAMLNKKGQGVYSCVPLNH